MSQQIKTQCVPLPTFVAPKPYRPTDLPISSNDAVIRLPPYYFVHILDSNTNVRRVEVGPQTITKTDNESIVLGPRQMITIPPAHYCIINDPIFRDDEGTPVMEGGQYKNRFGTKEVRTAQEPFPLYPDESVLVGVTELQTVPNDCALRLRAINDMTDSRGVKRGAGDEWLFVGPATYIPQVDAEIIEVVTAVVLKANQALKLRARNLCVDGKGIERKAGEEWLLKEEGSYLPGVDEVMVSLVNAQVLTDTIALHLEATRTFTDCFGMERKAGQEWIVTNRQASEHIPDVYERVKGIIRANVLSSSQFCVILDPVDENGVPQLGRKKLVRGCCSFFLQPGERLESGVQDVNVLGPQEALLIKAKEAFTDDDGVERRPGDRWLMYGPAEYVPSIEVEILDRREKMPLDLCEGVYVRDTQSGKVRAVVGESYMLREYEELWAKELRKSVETLLGGVRDPTRVITYRVPHNAVCQIYDFKEKTARVIFGPDLILLGPDEQFTMLSLSGGKPKRNHQIKALHLELGPEVSTDVIVVETSDHARLSLKLSYKWIFDVDKKNPDHARSLFQVPDFVGDFCKAIASRVRGAVASVPFDAFHKHSAQIINAAVFGTTKEGEIKPFLLFEINRLKVMAVDIQTVEPVDQRTRDALQKSVQMAIEITTSSQEAAAQHQAARTEQDARGALERQKILDQAQAEKRRAALLDLQSQCAAINTTGQATAEAKARAEAATIEGEANVEQAELRSQAQSIESQSELAQVTSHQVAEIEHQRALNELEIERARELSDIETAKFKSMVDSIGAETIKAMAQAGPEMQAKLLNGLGLQGYLVTDGNSPINLFNTANGLVGGGMPQ